MSIETKLVTRYVAVCDSCGRRFGSVASEGMAEWDLRTHKCGEHREQHDSTGGFRGILGGWNRDCVCGAHYVSETESEPFKCPHADSSSNPT